MANMEMVLISITREWAESGDQLNRVICIAYRKDRKGIGEEEYRKGEWKGQEKNGNGGKRGQQIGVG